MILKVDYFNLIYKTHTSCGFFCWAVLPGCQGRTLGHLDAWSLRECPQTSCPPQPHGQWQCGDQILAFLLCFQRKLCISIFHLLQRKLNIQSMSCFGISMWWNPVTPQLHKCSLLIFILLPFVCISLICPRCQVISPLLARTSVSTIISVCGVLASTSHIATRKQHVNKYRWVQFWLVTNNVVTIFRELQ